jgi:ATP-binding cassette subfamily B multidrug efflux pump
MLKILKNLKESWTAVIAIIILLCIQAAADLKLPDFTSQIVNVGIQQSGIENVAPEVIRKSTLDNLQYFTDDYETILENYEIVEKNEKNIKEYPLLESEEIYKLKNISKSELENLNNIISKPLMTLSVMSNEETANKIKEKMQSTNAESSQEIEQSQMAQMQALSTVLENGTLMDAIKVLPEEARESMLKEVKEQIDSMSDTILKQGAIAAVKNEYEAIGVSTTSISNKYIIKTGLQMLGVAMVTMISAISIMFLSSRVAARLGKTLREKVFRKVLSFSNQEFNEFSAASLITRSTNDIQQIQQLLSILFRVVVYAPIIAIGGLITVVSTSNLSMAWIIGLAVLAILIVVGTLFATTMPKFKKSQTLIDKLNLVSREILTGIPVIRAFNTQKREEDRFESANKDLMKNSVFVNSVMSMMMPIMMLIMNSIMILIIWVGGHNIDSGVMQVGDMMAFLQYTMQIVMSFLMISMISIMLPRASVSAKRINEVLEKEPAIEDKPELEQAKFDLKKKGLVEFRNVSFRYPDAESEILSDISFTANPGETTAIIGSTGSGKSTVVNLIPRFYDVTGGEILIDGVNIKDVSQKDLRSKIGFVPQKGILFSGTIESNIKYGKDITDDEMKRVAEIAQASEFIEKKDEKYDSEIAQGGNNVSGGQKQRLSIARALAIDPEIFVFDDSFSALDLKTDRNLRDALKKQTSGKTIIMVAQRVSTIMNAEQIIVLEDGKIVGKGTHEELLKNCETYKQIALSQLSSEELERKEV